MKTLYTILCPAVLIIAGWLVIALGVPLASEAGESGPLVMNVMSRIGVILVLGGLACGFVSYLSEVKSGG